MRVRRFVLARVDRLGFSFSVSVFSVSLIHRPSVACVGNRVRENCISIGYNFLNGCSGEKRRYVCAHSSSLRGAPATKQSILSLLGEMDCFASLAMTAESCGLAELTYSRFN